MKKLIFFLLLGSLFIPLFSSCNTTKRAQRRIYNITEEHPELVKPDTVKIDTVLTVVPAADSVIFAFDTIVENQSHTIRTERGEFSITILPTREVKINYLPDTVNFHYSNSIIREKIHIEKPRELWRDILLYLILTFVFCLLVKTLIEKIFK